MATFPNRPIPGSGWFRGLPPVGEFVAIAVRKWTGKHEGRPVEVIAGSPVMYLKALGLNLILSPSVTVLYGSIHMQGDIPMLMDERGSPVAVYPDCYLAWSKVPRDHVFPAICGEGQRINIGTDHRPNLSAPAL